MTGAWSQEPQEELIRSMTRLAVLNGKCETRKPHEGGGGLGRQGLFQTLGFQTRVRVGSGEESGGLSVRHFPAPRVPVEPCEFFSLI